MKAGTQERANSFAVLRVERAPLLWWSAAWREASAPDARRACEACGQSLCGQSVCGQSVRGQSVRGHARSKARRHRCERAQRQACMCLGTRANAPAPFLTESAAFITCDLKVVPQTLWPCACARPCMCSCACACACACARARACACARARARLRQPLVEPDEAAAPNAGDRVGARRLGLHGCGKSARPRTRVAEGRAARGRRVATCKRRSGEGAGAVVEGAYLRVR
eukprot:2832350-Pleurochrysis_carterae.AAC.1